MPIKVSIVDDVGSFLAGAGKVEGALEKVAGSLDDLAADAQRAGRQTGDGLADGVEGGTRDAGGHVDRLEQTFADLARAGSKQAKSIGDDVGDNVKRGYRDAERAAKDFGDTADRESGRAGEATSEFKDEAKSNLSEVASSFSGDMSSAADLVQGTLGGLAGSLAGPAGLAAAALAVVGGGLLSSVQANAEKSEQRISDMYDDFLESGAEYLSKDFIADQLAKIYQGADDAAVKVKALRDLANDSSIPEPLLARALVGDQAARDQVKSEIAAQRLKINEALDDATAKGQNMAPALAPAIQALQDVEDRVDGTSSAMTEAQRNAKAAGDAIAGIQAPTQGVAASAEDARAKFDGLGRQISSLPTSIPVTIDTSTADSELARWRARQSALVVGVVARPGQPQAV